MASTPDTGDALPNRDLRLPDGRDIVPPSEFVIVAVGKVVLSNYSSGPIGRMDASDTAAAIESYEFQKK